LFLQLIHNKVMIHVKIFLKIKLLINLKLMVNYNLDQDLFENLIFKLFIIIYGKIFKEIIFYNYYKLSIIKILTKNTSNQENRRKKSFLLKKD